MLPLKLLFDFQFVRKISFAYLLLSIGLIIYGCYYKVNNWLYWSLTAFLSFSCGYAYQRYKVLKGLNKWR